MRRHRDCGSFRGPASNIVFSTIPYLGQHLTGDGRIRPVVQLLDGVRHTLPEGCDECPGAGGLLRAAPHRVQFPRVDDSPDVWPERHRSRQSNTPASHPADRAEQHSPQDQHATRDQRVDGVADSDVPQYGPPCCGHQPLDSDRYRDDAQYAQRIWRAINAVHWFRFGSLSSSETSSDRRGSNGLANQIVRRGSQHCGAVSHLVIADPKPGQSASPRGMRRHDPDDGFGFRSKHVAEHAGSSCWTCRTPIRRSNKRGVLHAESHLSFGYSALGGVTHATAIAVDATSALSLGQSAYSIRESATVSDIQLGDLAEVVSSKPTGNQVVLGQRAIGHGGPCPVG